MKIRILSLVLAGLFLSACDAMQGLANEEPNLDKATDAQKRSYALGMDIGSKLGELPVDLDREYIAAGLRDALAKGDRARLDEEEFQKTMEGFVAELEVAQREQASAAADANRQAGETFLAENAEKEGVEVTDSGLQYQVLEEGDGASPASDDRVRVHYEGRLPDGTVFDSSRERGQPVTFPLDAVIPGWSEGLQLMTEGARYRLFVPSELAYGERGAGAEIGPNQTLVFDVELLKVNPEPEEESQP